ncbi:MAG: hypothetical protein JOZ17_01075 [Acetobacteraceae bacterium]|nr:hypothetical protein [Acetobacteraceae bacterium]
MIAHAEPLLDQPGDVGAGPGTDTVALRIGTLQDQRTHRRELTFREPRRPVLGAVDQAGNAFRVVANNSIPQRLSFHARQPRRLRPGHAFQRVRDGKCTGCRSRMTASSRPASQFTRPQIAPDRQPRHRRHPMLPEAANHSVAASGNPLSSQVERSTVLLMAPARSVSPD